ncbi:MAG TPA: alpha/beta hydrolase [Marmoricola sp.]|nr:alpha/beta hydrolase [Marmoricola sp.]
MSYTPEPPVEATREPEPPRRNPVLVGVLVGVLVFVVAAAGFAGWRAVANDDDPAAAPSSGATSPTPSATSSASVTLPGTDPRLARFYDQKLSWHDCDRDRCAQLTVPLDYAKPGGRTLKLAVLKVPATGKREGALVVNPGGPGGSGVGYAAAGSLQFGSALSSAFDIVGFDPRGVGQSDPLHCVDTAELDKLVAFDPDPDTRAERNQMDSLIHSFGQGCLDHSGALTRHMSTDEVARDMDILRAALGQRKLDYLGASYGTFIGATYANLFPNHVGRFVLDGAIDPSLSNEQLSLAQAHGFETALRAYVKDCVDDGSCFLGSNVDAGIQKIQSFLLSVEKTPLPTGRDRQLTEGLAMLGIWMPLYVKEYWPQLSAALKQAMDDGDGGGLLSLADAYTSRGPSGYTDNSMEALYAVNCLDHDDSIATKDVPSHFAEFEKASPTFGRAFAFGLSTCSDWPVRSGKHTVALHAAGAPPIVVIGTTRDPATPLAWAQALAHQLESGRLITRDGDGHTGFQRGNSCVDDAVERWLVDGTVPKPDLHC